MLIARNAGSDYMSWTRNGYPSAFATEGDPLKGGFPGDFDPYVHTDKDVMDIDNDRGVFSIDVSVVSYMSVYYKHGKKLTAAHGEVQ
jgi:Zn-dependent M28 family amino/carboxypeptidase